MEVVPCQGGLELVTAGPARPLLGPLQRVLARQSEHGVPCISGAEIPLHGIPRGDGDVQVGVIARCSPESKQAAYDDSAVEKVRKRLRRIAITGALEREGFEGRTPGDID